MNKSFFIKNREKITNIMRDSSALLLSSGFAKHKNADAEYKFLVNSDFFYLTGIEQEATYLLIVKKDNVIKTILFIEDFDEFKEKWFGKKLTKEEAVAISGIDNVVSSSKIDFYIDALFANSGRGSLYGKLDACYLDLEFSSLKYYTNFGYETAKHLQDKFPNIDVLDCHALIVGFRVTKEKDEINCINESLKITKLGLDLILKNLKPNMMEYEVEAYFNFALNTNNTYPAFDTIAVSGANAVILHYVQNNNILHDGDLILLDLGAKNNNYSSDISRTYPINGKYNKLQKEIYEIVLNANKRTIEYIKVGMSTKEVNEYTTKLLAEGCLRAKLIKDISEISNYYYHGVSHSLGLDTHDPVGFCNKIEENMVLTVEPGLYFKEHGIGIRIEDNILVKDSGNINLSKDIIKEINEIEDFMKNA